MDECEQSESYPCGILEGTESEVDMLDHDMKRLLALFRF